MNTCSVCGAACEEADSRCRQCGAAMNCRPLAETGQAGETQPLQAETQPQGTAPQPAGADETQPHKTAAEPLYTEEKAPPLKTQIQSPVPQERRETPPQETEMPQADEKNAPEPAEGAKLFWGILGGVLLLLILMVAIVTVGALNKPGGEKAYLSYQTPEGDLYYVAPRSGKAVLLADTADWDSTPYQIVSPTGKSYAYFSGDTLYAGRTDQAESAEKIADSIQDAFWGEEGDILQFVDEDGAYYSFKDGKIQKIASSVMQVGNTDGHHLYYVTPRGNLYVQDVTSLMGHEKKIAAHVESIEASGKGGLYYFTQENELYYLKEGGNPVLLDTKASELINAQFETGKTLYTDEEENCIYTKPGAKPLQMKGNVENGYVADFDREVFFIVNGDDILRYKNGEAFVLRDVEDLTYSFEEGIAWCVNAEGELQAYKHETEKPVIADTGVAWTLDSIDDRCLYLKEGANGESKLYLAELGKEPRLLESGKYGFYAELFEKGVVYAKYRDEDGARVELWICPTGKEPQQVYTDAGAYGFWGIDDLYYQDINGALYWYNGKESILIDEDCAKVGKAR